MTGDLARHALIYGLLVMIGITGGVGDICIFSWSKSGKWWWLGLAALSWLVSLGCFAVYLQWDNRTVSTATVLTTVFHVALVIVCDCIYYGGRLNRMEWLGMVFALAAILLLELGRDKAPKGAGARLHGAATSVQTEIVETRL